MNADRLLAHYERIADAPDAIARLRRFILDLAVRGKLVPQDANDEPASELLKRITSKRAEMVKSGDVKPAKKTLDQKKSEHLFELRNGWVWTTANELWDFENGDRSKNYPSKDQLVDVGIPFVNAGHLVCGRVDLSEMNYISREKFQQLGSGKLRYGDQLYCLRGSLGKHARFLHEGNAAIASSLVILRPIDHDVVPYLSFYLDSEIALAMLKRFDNGTAQPNLSSANLRIYQIPLPPLAEQRRIAAKVDELMGLCDRLEAARAGREAMRDQLAAASLARLNAPDPETFQADARFALDALPALTTRPDQIKRLRQTMLNLAVRGKLVPQDANDEPASELTKRISRTRKKLYAEKRVPKPKELPFIDELDLPFAAPSGWAWSMLGDLCYQVSDGPHFSPQYVSAEAGVPFLSARNVRLGSFDLSTVKHVSRADHEEFCKRIRPEKGDIIYTKGGTTGIAKVNDLDFEFSVWVHLAVLRIEKTLLYPRYVELALNSPHCYAQSQHYTQGTSNFDLGLTRMIKITLPLPPLAEQHRIVAKVDALMALCDRLEASLDLTAATRRRLLDALLAEALAPVAVREMEAAE